MKCQALSLLLVVFLLWAAPPNKSADKAAKDVPTKPGDKAANSDECYARVAVRGCLNMLGMPGEPQSIFMPRDPPTRPKGQYLEMDISKLKDWTPAKLYPLNGRLVLVTGTLEMVPVKVRGGKTEERLMIVAKTLKVEEDKDAPPGSKD